jgi:hypothetical protein
MARSARGLPENFSLDLPDEKPTVIGDFLDEDPPALPVKRAPKRQAETESRDSNSELRVAITREPVVAQRPAPAPIPVPKQQPSVIRYQLNCTPKSKVMLEELVEYVRTYSPQSDARTSEVFQGMMTLLHSAMNELELSDLPKRGAWGSVTAKNFPGALSDAFERAILAAARKRGRV